jgi:two-component system, chemotaxis family, response regulator Rcp1
VSQQPPQVLLVDDNPADVELVCEASARGRYRSEIHNEVNGEKALAYLRSVRPYGARARPDLILLDLNLPGKDGRKVLAELKGDPSWRRIPVVVFSTSQSERDIWDCYDAGANCYVSKPLQFENFVSAIRSIEELWFGFAQLPEESNDGIACERAID